jgi:hypothetical protein
MRTLTAVVLLIPSLASSQSLSPQGHVFVNAATATHTTGNPTKAECLIKARPAIDPVWLSHRPASEINELDWQLSVCESRFIPPEPEGAMLICEAHGFAADEFRRRVEKAVSTLTPDLQKRVWDAFNSDAGEPNKK